MTISKSKLRKTFQMVRKPRKGGLIIGVLWLSLGLMWMLRGGSFIVFAVITVVFLLGIFVVPVLERTVANKELLGDIQDFEQERLLPLMEKLKSWGVEATMLNLSSNIKGKFRPPVSFKTFESLGLLRLRSHEVDLIHIGYWTDEKFRIEAFYLDLVVECEVKEESRITTELKMMNRFILFGRRGFEWWGGELTQLLNQDGRLKENLPYVSAIMEMPALWVVPSAEEGLVRIHIPYVKRVDPEQFPSILAAAERIAQHIKSLA
jgi:hypothetical protein